MIIWQLYQQSVRDNIIKKWVKYEYSNKKNIPIKPTKPNSSIDILVLVNLIAKKPCPTTDKTIKKQLEKNIK